MSKKYILFIVEGKNDKSEISAILDMPRFAKYKEKYEFRFFLVGNDVTANNKVKSVQGELTKYVLTFRKRMGDYPNIRTSDIQEVVHIVDLDGAFIPLDSICRSEERDYEYTDTNIFTKDVDNARGRNKRKSEALKKLAFDVNRIDNIPYSIYFVSKDMDHCLFDKRNLSAQEKRDLSIAFRDKCEENPNVLDESVFKPGVATDNDYEGSWLYISQPGLESLLRHTNLNLFFGDGAKNPK